MQGSIPHYRVPFFNCLAARPEIDLTLAHSGPPTSGNGVLYREQVMSQRTFWRFVYQRGLFREAAGYDAIVGMFDLQHISLLHLFFARQSTPFIWWGIGFGNHPIANQIRVSLVRRCDALVVYMLKAKERFISQGIASEKVFVAPNTVEVKEPSVNRNSATRKCFLFVGSLDSRKKLDELVRAFAKARLQLSKDVTLDVVGDGAARGDLSRLVVELGLGDAVRFHGRVTDEAALTAYFSRALAVVSPGQAGLSVLHSFAHGVPFITRQNAISGGEIDNIINGINGILYEGGAGCLADNLAHLALNPDVSVRMGKQAYEHYVNHRRIDHMVEGFVSAIYYALAQRGTAPSHSN